MNNSDSLNDFLYENQKIITWSNQLGIDFVSISLEGILIATVPFHEGSRGGFGIYMLRKLYAEECCKILGDHDGFIDQIVNYCAETPIKFDKMFVDHIARRTSTLDNYFELQKRINKVGTLLGEKDINGRPVSIYQFDFPLYTELGEICYLELLAPKQGKEYPDAYDHVEFVTKQDLHKMVKKYSKINFQTKGLSKDYNQELEIEFEENLSIKFHNQSIDEVLRYEDNIK